MVLKNARANTLSFQIVTTSTPQTFTLPLGSSATYTQDFTIDWGDGSSSVITAYDDVDKVHTYTTAGTYNLEIVGTCEYFGFNNTGDKTLLKRLNGLRGEVGLRYVNFFGCSNLDYVDSTMNLWYSVKSFSSCFKSCTSLTAIPSGLFDNTVLVNDFSYCFRYCTSLTAIPSGLFDNTPLVTTFEECFINCSNVTSIPSGLFDNNTLVTTFKYCFGGCDGLTSIPANLFDNNVLVTTFESCFDNCDGLTSIVSGLFDNNALVTTFLSCFKNSTNITTIPSGLFDNNPIVINLSQCFYGCTSLTAIPSGLFDNNTIAQAFVSCFTGCTSLTAIPSGLFDNNTIADTFRLCFHGCTGINTDLPIDLILYNTILDNCQDMFFSCNNMTGLGVPFVTTGVAHGVTSHATCFAGCTSLTDYASIPAGWK